MKVHLQRRGGALIDGQASMPSRTAMLLRMFVAFVLCCGLMIPGNLVVQRAWANDEPTTSGATITDDQQKQLRQSSDTGTVSVSLENVTDEWIDAVTSVTVTSLGGNDEGTQTVLDSSQYTITSSSITFTRTEAAPVFSVETGEGEELEITNRWGTTITYPQSKAYKITIAADGYADTEGEVTFYTGSSDTFSIIVVEEDGTETTVRTFTQDEMEALASFQNGSSQCGMTGFRTFSGYGVSLTDLLELADVEVSADDYFLVQTTDQYGNEFTYEELFGTTRYFLQSVYDDEEVKATYAELVESDDEAGALIELRKLLAAKALEDGSTVEPMIATRYVETLISGDDVATAVLPTAESVTYNLLVAAENQYRFIYGIAIVQEDCTVTFETGEGSDVASQTVKSNYMTSTANTTMWSSYWVNSLIIYRGQGEASSSTSTAADTLTVPEDPTRDGYVFDGWYTKDGSEDGDWGEEFDFSANNGTVDTDTTLYAKWVLAEDGESGSGTTDGSSDESNGNSDSGSTLPGDSSSDNDSTTSTASGDSFSDNDSITSTVSDDVVDDATDSDGGSAATSDTLAKTGDSTPVVPVVCVALGAAVLAFIAFMARRGSFVRLGRYIK